MLILCDIIGLLQLSPDCLDLVNSVDKPDYIGLASAWTHIFHGEHSELREQYGLGAYGWYFSSVCGCTVREVQSRLRFPQQG